MKKVFYISLVLVLCLLLVACGSKGIKDASGAKKAVDATMAEYEGAGAASVKFTFKEGEISETVSMTYKLNATKDKIEELAYVSSNPNGEVSVYIKDGMAYMNSYGNKTKKAFSDAENKICLEKYTFKSIRDAFEYLFNDSFYSSSSVASSSKGLVLLDCNIMNLQPNSNLDDDAYFDAEEKFEKLKEKKSLTLEVSYNNDKATKLVGVAIDNDDVQSTMTVEFLGTVANINYPSFDGYVEPAE